MLLTQREYNGIILRTLENDNPSRLCEYLENINEYSGNLNPKYWSHINDLVVKLDDEITGDEYYDLKEILENDKVLTNDHKKYIFIYHFSAKKISDRFENLRFTKRYTIQHLVNLTDWLDRTSTENKIRYKFQEALIKIYTKNVLSIAFNRYLLKTKELLKATKECLIAYIELYFSIRVPSFEITNEDKVVFIDKGNRNMLYSYKSASTKRNDNNDFSQIFVNRFNDYSSGQSSNRKITQTDFKSHELEHWRKIREQFEKSDPQYSLLTKYIGKLPQFKIVNKSKKSFGINKDYYPVLVKIFNDLNNLDNFVFFASTKSTPNDLADLLTTEDFMQNNIKPVYFRCEAILVVAILDFLFQALFSFDISSLGPKIETSNKFQLPKYKKPTKYIENKDNYFSFSPLKYANIRSHKSRWQSQKEDGKNYDLKIAYTSALNIISKYRK